MIGIPEIGKAIILLDRLIVERSFREGDRKVRFDIDVIPKQTIVLVWSHDPIDFLTGGPSILWNDLIWVCVPSLGTQGVHWKYV